MIVDDSMVARSVLSRMIESDDSFEIAAVAGTARTRSTRSPRSRSTHPLDLEMPGAGGLNPFRAFSTCLRRQVLIVSSMAEEGAEETVAALALGAADTLPKPGTGRFNGRFSEVLMGELKALGYAEYSGSVTAFADAPVLRDRAASRQCRENRLSCWRSVPGRAASTHSTDSSTRFPNGLVCRSW